MARTKTRDLLSISRGEYPDNTIVNSDLQDNSITAAKIADNEVNAAELNVSGNGTAGQFLISDGDGSFSWSDLPVNGTAARYQYTVSSTTSTITGVDDNGNTLSYDAPNVDVYLNGIRMVNGDDVTVTSGTSVVFASAIGVSDTDYVDIVAFGTFEIGQVSTTDITSGTLAYARGGTGLSALGSADEVLQVNAGGTALEYGKVDSANIADNAVGATQLNVSGNGTSGQMLTSDGDGSMSWADAPSSFAPTTLADSSIQTLDLGSYNYFDGGTATSDRTLIFSNVPTEARWTYTADLGINDKSVSVSGFNVKELGPIGGDGFIGPNFDVQAGLEFDSSGKNLFTMDQYAQFVKIGLGVPFDVTSADSDIAYQTLNVSATTGTDGRHVIITPDASRIYAMGADNNRIYQWTMSTPGDLSSVGTASSFLHSSQLTAPIGWCFNNGGSKMFIMGYNQPGVYEYNLSTPWDVTTASYNVVYNYTTATGTISGGNVVSQGDIEVSRDNKKLYFCVASGTRAYHGIHEIPLSGGSLSGTVASEMSYSIQDIRAININQNTGRLYMTDINNLRHVTYVSSGKKYNLKLPSGVNNSYKLSEPNKRKTLEFVTTDGGTNVKIINDNDTD